MVSHYVIIIVNFAIAELGVLYPASSLFAAEYYDKIKKILKLIVLQTLYQIVGLWSSGLYSLSPGLISGNAL